MVEEKMVMNLKLHFSTFGAHPFVPKSKVQSIIGRKFFVMKMMVRGVDPQFTKLAFSKRSWINLDIQMIDHTAEGHQNQIKQQHVNIHRNKN